MCGLAGFVGLWSAPLLEAMMAALRHRGPARPLIGELTGEEAVARRWLFDAAAVAALRRGFLGRRAHAAIALFALMGVELWCRALDAAPALSAPQARAATG